MIATALKPTVPVLDAIANLRAHIARELPDYTLENRRYVSHLAIQAARSEDNFLRFEKLHDAVVRMQKEQRCPLPDYVKEAMEGTLT